jgi:hypothetical protein
MTYIDNEKSKNKTGSSSNLYPEQLAITRQFTVNVIDQLNSDASVPFYPLIIETTADHQNSYRKQFGDIIGKKLQKKLEPIINLEET